MLNRRHIITSAALAVSPFIASAEESDQSTVMTMLIEEVIRDGDMSNLKSIVAENVSVATLGVSDIEGFEQVSIEGHDARESEFSSLEMNIVSMAESGQWVHALVRAEGELRTGRKQNLSLFYVAEFRDGLIARLYFG